MSNLKNLCESLARAEFESDVIDTLKKYNYWDNNDDWVDYGNNENNFSSIGNQQGSADAALVEKIINSTDAILINECLKNNIDPESSDAPQSIKKALKEFFNFPEGQIASISSSERTKHAQLCGLVATGHVGRNGDPTLTIFDRGCGQEPSSFPDTFLSLNASNKIKINFVQGKFNMGSTGVLPFCGKHHLQLIVSRRNPLISSNNERSNEWGFTVVRREKPTGMMKSSKYTYLAPKNKVLSFAADSLQIIPSSGDLSKVYDDHLEYGSFVKLYEYKIGAGLKTAILFDLYNRLNLLMPNMALPVRLFERRNYKGHSYETTLSGLLSRVSDDKRENLENGFPDSASVLIDGQQISIQIFVFKIKNNKNAKDNYSKKEGVVFSVNGQAQGHIGKSIFSKVGLGYLKDSLLVHVDCSDLSNESIEEVFMNSRDRLRDDSPLKNKIVDKIQELLSSHPELKNLSNSRRDQKIHEEISDNKPIADILKKVISHSPTLSKLLLKGIRLNTPFRTVDTKNSVLFEGKEFPTFFSPSKTFDETSPKICEYERKINIKFKTDVANDYFTRTSTPGRIEFISDLYGTIDSSVHIFNGSVTVVLNLPSCAEIGQKSKITYLVMDDSRAIPLSDDFWIEVEKNVEKNVSKNNNNPRKSTGEKEGGNDSGKSQLDLPEINPIKQNQWDDYDIDGEHALCVVPHENSYDFFYNKDNIYLLHEQKSAKDGDEEVIETQFKSALVLVGLSIINSLSDCDDKDEIQSHVKKVTKEIAPVLLPIIRGLGGLIYK